MYTIWSTPDVHDLFVRDLTTFLCLNDGLSKWRSARCFSRALNDPQQAHSLLPLGLSRRRTDTSAFASTTVVWTKLHRNTYTLCRELLALLIDLAEKVIFTPWIFGLGIGRFQWLRNTKNKQRSWLTMAFSNLMWCLSTFQTNQQRWNGWWTVCCVVSGWRFSCAI